MAIIHGWFLQIAIYLKPIHLLALKISIPWSSFAIAMTWLRSIEHVRRNASTELGVITSALSHGIWLFNRMCHGSEKFDFLELGDIKVLLNKKQVDILEKCMRKMSGNLDHNTQLQRFPLHFPAWKIFSILLEAHTVFF